MNKLDVTKLLAEKMEMSVAKAKLTLETLLASFAHSLKKGEAITLVGFGTFLVKQRAPRKVRNLRTGEYMQVPAKRVVQFKAGKSLKDQVK